MKTLIAVLAWCLLLVLCWPLALLALVLYPLVMRGERASLLSESEDEVITEYGEPVALAAETAGTPPAADVAEAKD